MKPRSLRLNPSALNAPGKPNYYSHHCTVSVTDPVRPLAVAVIVVEPVVSSDATPVVDPILATAVLEEVQVGVTADPLLVAVNVTVPLISVAVNVEPDCERQPEQEIVKLPVDELTVSVVNPETPLSAAVIVVVPVVAAVASPVLLMLATLVAEEVHVTDEVTSLLLLSPNVPVAVNCWVPLKAIVGLAGVTVIATSEPADGKNCPQLAASSTGRMRNAIL